jgi:tripartite-type tricarboxylate transporter receptor subunit TctC
MPTMLRKSLAACLAVVLLALGGGAALAQTAAGKTIRIVVPFPPGGTADVIARIIAQQAGQAGGGSFVIENRPGAGTIIATDLVNRAAPDGTTLLLMANSFVINPSVRASLPYDPLTFEPICLLVNSPQVVVVNSASPYQTLAELFAAAKARPGELSYATVGPATTQHIAGEALRRAAGLNLTYVPYPGGAPAVNALLGGHVVAVLTNYSEVMEQVNAGKLRALAVTTRERIPPLPNVPTLSEAGHKDQEAAAWFGMMAPPKTPKETTAQLITLIKAALQAPEVSAKLIAQGLYPVGACGADFAEHIRKQHESYARLVRELNIKTE